jgi:hypothetical protein
VAPATVRELREAALADERGDQLRIAVARHGLAASAEAPHRASGHAPFSPMKERFQ